MDKGWCVYIIKTKSGKLYTGITTDLDRRFKEHAGEKSGGAKFFRTSTAKEILFIEKHKNRSEASKREYEIKSMSRSDKLMLIKANNR